MDTFYAVGKTLAKRVEIEDGVSYFILRGGDTWLPSDYLLRSTLGMEDGLPPELSADEARKRFPRAFKEAK